MASIVPTFDQVFDLGAILALSADESTPLFFCLDKVERPKDPTMLEEEGKKTMPFGIPSIKDNHERWAAWHWLLEIGKKVHVYPAYLSELQNRVRLFFPDTPTTIDENWDLAITIKDVWSRLLKSKWQLFIDTWSPKPEFAHVIQVAAARGLLQANLN